MLKLNYRIYLFVLLFVFLYNDNRGDYMNILEISCDNGALGPILMVVKNILGLIQIVVPILLIVMLIIRIIGLVHNPDDKKGLKRILNMFIAAIIVFFIPMIVNVIMGAIGEETLLSDCWNKTRSFRIGGDTYIDPYNDGEEKRKIIKKEDYEKGISGNGALKKGTVTKILFVGNSKTDVSDIPGKFTGIANSNGYNVDVRKVTRGGATLSDLANNYASIIGSESFDCVVLQEQTDVYGSNYEAYSNGAKKVINIVRSKNSNVKIYIRALWIRNSSPTSARNNSYSWTEKIARETNSFVIYDGKAFDKSSSSNNINLFGDDIHQNENGAYLSSLTIYKTLSGDKTIKTNYYAGLDSNTAKELIRVVNN